MPFMLPAAPSGSRNIAGVAQDLLGALSGEESTLPAARSVVLLVVDGLGAIDLRRHSGHARRLTTDMGKKDVAQSIFPSTTAAALTTILTGTEPGVHGLVGYRTLDAERDVLVNQLSGWETDGLDPATWQRADTIFQKARAQGRAAFALGLPRYARSGFTSAVLRGAEYRGESRAGERVAHAVALAEENDGALVYCYLPEIDKAGHRHGVDSAAWVAALEEVDAALPVSLPGELGMLVTADHGMVDVPVHRQLILDPDDALLAGVRHIGGEPRMLHVYLEPGAEAAVFRERWSASLERRADVLTREEAIAGGLFGATVADAVRPRIGDLLVLARGSWALYDGRDTEHGGRGMIGQHGSITPEERTVPYLRRGVFAKA